MPSPLSNGIQDFSHLYIIIYNTYLPREQTAALGISVYSVDIIFFIKIIIKF